MSKKTEALEVILGLMPNAKFIDKNGKDVTEDMKKSHNVAQRNSQDLTGKRFGKLTAVSYSHKGKDGKLYWRFICDCGKETITQLGNAVSGNTKSCGCWKKEIKKTHGFSDDRLYTIWCNMKSRCYNKKRKDYEKYGGNGITVCDLWVNSFESFYEWSLGNGYCENLTLDRIDINRNYCPENCRWVDRHIQASNRGLSKNNKTGFVGVRKSGKKYQARLVLHNTEHNLGSFNTISEAVLARNEYITKHNLGEYKIQEIKNG